jgi:NAD dependent epimerase/dehydratase family enzyme
MRALRSAVGMPVGIVMPAWLLKIGAALIRTEPELILKSRRVIPTRLLANGYQFRFDKIENALDDLCKHAA